MASSYNGANCLKVCIFALQKRFCRNKYEVLHESSESLLATKSEDQSALPDVQPAVVDEDDRDQRKLRQCWEEYFQIFDINLLQIGAVSLLKPSRKPFLRQSNGRRRSISKTVRSALMIRLDVNSSGLENQWQEVAERMGGTYEYIKFLANRQEYSHESPTQHLVNIFELTNLPVAWLRKVFSDIERDDLIQILDNEIIGTTVGRKRKEKEPANLRLPFSATSAAETATPTLASQVTNDAALNADNCNTLDKPHDQL